MVAADLFLMDRYNLTFEGETTSQVGGYATRCEMARFLSPICASATERFFSAFLLQTMCRPISRSSPCAAGKSRDSLWHLGCIQGASNNRANRRHEVPETAPDKAYAMLRGVLEGRLF